MHAKAQELPPLRFDCSSNLAAGQAAGAPPAQLLDANGGPILSLTDSEVVRQFVPPGVHVVACGESHTDSSSRPDGDDRVPGGSPSTSSGSLLSPLEDTVHSKTAPPPVCPAEGNSVAAAIVHPPLDPAAAD
eukprot:TRINITY_DN15094_c0_g1_i1.p2 TRINITY_DN15094_c0_g1~~TRINITY_DN15094_c0_g1_i1.p2  ORF type:complete len:132 (-),score=16.16 TRINITY_DN15094_c0_g1_i1:394-789(-)